MKTYTVEMEIKIVAEDEYEASEQALYYVRSTYPIQDVCITCQPYCLESED